MQCLIVISEGVLWKREVVVWTLEGVVWTPSSGEYERTWTRHVNPTICHTLPSMTLLDKVAGLLMTRQNYFQNAYPIKIDNATKKLFEIFFIAKLEKD